MIAADQPRPAPADAQAAGRRRGGPHRARAARRLRRVPAAGRPAWSRTMPRRCPRACAACTCRAARRSRCGWPAGARCAVDDVREFTAVVFGAGDHRTRTEDRAAAAAAAARRPARARPAARDGRCGMLGHPRLVALRFDGTPDAIWAGLARHGRPIQYAHVPRAAGAVGRVDADRRRCRSRSSRRRPASCSTGALLAALRARGVGFATITHAAGISSTGDAELDARLPFDEPYRIPAATGDGDRADASARAAASSRSAPPWCARSSTRRRATAACAPATASRPADRRRHRAARRRRDPVAARTSRARSHYELLRAFAERRRCCARDARELERARLPHARVRRFGADRTRVVERACKID